MHQAFARTRKDCAFKYDRQPPAASRQPPAASRGDIEGDLGTPRVRRLSQARPFHQPVVVHRWPRAEGYLRELSKGIGRYLPDLRPLSMAFITASDQSRSQEWFAVESLSSSRWPVG